MSEYEQVIDEIVKHGVVVKVDKIVDDNYVASERRYVGCVVKLDFTEHDKVFEDKIAELKNIINHKLGDWDKHGITYQEILDMKAENDKSKQRIAELESKNNQLTESILRKETKIHDLESKETYELPFDPLECANYLINATYERETNGIERAFQNLPEKVNSDRYTVDELEQIAEHLLIYCRHNKE